MRLGIKLVIKKYNVAFLSFIIIIILYHLYFHTPQEKV